MIPILSQTGGATGAGSSLGHELGKKGLQVYKYQPGPDAAPVHKFQVRQRRRQMSALYEKIFSFCRTHKAHPNRITVDYDMVYLGNSDIQV